MSLKAAPPRPVELELESWLKIRMLIGHVLDHCIFLIVGPKCCYMILGSIPPCSMALSPVIGVLLHSLAVQAGNLRGDVGPQASARLGLAGHASLSAAGVVLPRGLVAQGVQEAGS